MLISVIIPVYNVEKYLGKCVDSILSQTFQDIEIILVDDGSTDRSSIMCDELSTKDSRIQVIHKRNDGPSVARNLGLKSAKGDYVVFVDSDDFWADEKCLEELINEVKRTPECDFIGFNCSYYYEVKNKVVRWCEYAPEIQETCDTGICIKYLVASGVFPMSQCMKIIKKNVADRLEFKKGIYCEDIEWFIDLLKVSNKCRFINHYMYMYRKTDIGTRSSHFTQKQFVDLYNLLLKNSVQEDVLFNKDKQVHKALLSFWAYEYCILLGMLGYMSKTEKMIWRPKLLKYEWLLKYRMNPKVNLLAKIRRLFGRRLTEYILYRYLCTRMS